MRTSSRQNAQRSDGLTVSLVGPARTSVARAREILEGGGLAVGAQATSTVQLRSSRPLGDAVVAVWDTFGADEANDLRELAEEAPTVPLVVVADSRNRRTVRDALDAGATGFVSIERVAEGLPQTVRSVCAGQLTVPAEMRNSIGRPRLSPREKQIMAMVVMGFTNREIANKLYVAESTVKSHLSSTFDKLGVRSRQEATTLILDSSHGLGTGILKITDEQLEPAAAATGR